MTSCPPSAPVPPVGKLRARGVTVFAGSDNIRDCWSPYGNGDMLDRAAIIAERHALFTDRELEDAFALTTSEADKALGRPRRELRVGAVADLVVVAAPSVADAVVDRPPRALVLRAGASRPSEASPPRRSGKWWSRFASISSEPALPLLPNQWLTGRQTSTAAARASFWTICGFRSALTK